MSAIPSTVTELIGVTIHSLQLLHFRVIGWRVTIPSTILAMLLSIP